MAERTYRIHMAAELSGVREELIRAWERRYGVLSPRRTPSGYRVYTDQDVALLKRLKQLTEEGVSISEAAKMLPQLQAELGAMSSVEVAQGHSSAEAWCAAVLEAAEAFDQARVSAVLDEVFAALPPLRAFHEVLVPVQREVGERWHAGTFTVAQEHLVSQVVRARLVSLLHSAPENQGRRHGVLACFPEEDHEVGLLGVALRLRHAGVRVTVLGQRVPALDLGRVVDQLRPDFVGLSAVVDDGAEVFEEALVRVQQILPKHVPIWVGGAAARAHREVCDRRGVRVFQEEDDWVKLMSGS